MVAQDWGQHRAGQLSKLMEPSDTGNFNTISRSSINSRVAATTASTVKNCKFDNTLRTRHAAPAATRSTERDAAATAVRRDAGERAASTGERAPPVTSRMEPAGGCMVAAGQQDRGRGVGRNRRFERQAGWNRRAAAWSQPGPQDRGRGVGRNRRFERQAGWNRRAAAWSQPGP